MFRLHARSLALSTLLVAGCHYDIDKIYEHKVPDAGAVADAQADAQTPLPDDLIDLFQGAPFVNDSCTACAKSLCGDVNEACRADPECAALVECMAQSADPETTAICRAQHSAWLSEDISGRALGGPYYACVFRDSCAEECSTHTDWSCLGEYSWGKTSASNVPMRIRFTDALTGEAAKNLKVKVCRDADLECATPASEGTTDDDGVIALELPTPLRLFVGYLELTGSGWYPTIVQFGWPITRESVVPLAIINQAGVEQNVRAADVAPDPSRGLLQIRMFGCAGIGMRGVSFSSNKSDATSRTWYADPLPRFTATETGDFGNGGIINVPAGLNEVSATRTSDGMVVARASAPVRPGFITVVVLSPRDSSQ